LTPTTTVKQSILKSKKFKYMQVIQARRKGNQRIINFIVASTKSQNVVERPGHVEVLDHHTLPRPHVTPPTLLGIIWCSFLNVAPGFMRAF